MKTKQVVFFCDSRVKGLDNAKFYTEALSDWMIRSGVTVKFELQQAVSGTLYQSGPIQQAPFDWESLFINVGFAEEHTVDDATMNTDGATGCPVIEGLYVPTLLSPFSPQFDLHVRTIAHELQHIYNPLEGYKLSTFIDNPPTGHKDLSWDWRTTNTDMGRVFERNPGLREDPWVGVTMPFRKATMCEFNKILWQLEIRNPWEWSKRGWFSELAVSASRTGVARAYLMSTVTVGVDRFIVDRVTNQVFAIEEFLLAEMKTGRKNIQVPADQLPEQPPAPPVTPPVTPQAIANMRDALLKARQHAGSLVGRLVVLDETLKSLEESLEK